MDLGSLIPMIFHERKDKLPGGLGDKSKPSDFDPKEVAMGVEVEMEHTDDPDIALEICLDHLKEDPKYYTKLKRVHKEGIMDIGHFVNLLEDIRYELGEAAVPPPHRSAERKKAGLKALPTRRGAQPPPIPLKAKKKGVDPKSDVGKALSTVRELSKQGAREADAKKRQVHKDKSDTARWKKMAANKPAYGTKKLGITRSYSMGSASGKKPDPEGNVSRLGKVVRQRASHGESISNTAAAIRSILESEERYGGGSPLNPRERAAKGLPKYGTPKWRSKLSAKMKAKHK